MIAASITSATGDRCLTHPVRAGVRRAFALNPALDVSQYAHTAWRIRDGFFKGAITSIAQTPDGYLWLGTEFGLLRFDGVRGAAVAAAAGISVFRPSDIRACSPPATARCGSAPIKGLASWKDGTLTQLRGARRAAISAGSSKIAKAPMWADRGSLNRWTLCAMQDGRRHVPRRRRRPWRRRARLVWRPQRQPLGRDGDRVCGDGNPGHRTFYPIAGRERTGSKASPRISDGSLLISRQPGESDGSSTAKRRCRTHSRRRAAGQAHNFSAIAMAVCGPEHRPAVSCMCIDGITDVFARPTGSPATASPRFSRIVKAISGWPPGWS